MDLQFYPTPPEVGKRLVNMIHDAQPPILEPSAGNGDLAQALIDKRRDRWAHRPELKDFNCIEMDENRAATLRGKHFKVVWDDFLTFNPVTPYRTIIMNPPFNDGASHLLKALNILSGGGELACILNAETIRNPYDNERKILIQQLEACEEYQCEFVQDAFPAVNVEIALIHVKKKPPTVRCETFENYKRLVIEEAQKVTSTALIHGETDNTKRDVLFYQATVKSALHLFDELTAFNGMVKRINDVVEVFEMKNRFEERYDLVKKINGAFWKKFLYSEEIARLMTNDVRQAYASKLNEMREYEFNEVNILQLKADLAKNLNTNIDDAIMKVWKNFTARFSWRDEKSPNVHYYNGWKTNNAFKCNSKVVIPLYAFSNWTQNLELYRVRDELSDIEKAMNYLDDGRTEDSDMANKLEVAQARGIHRGIDTKYFTVDLFKKGTCHLKFKDMELLKKFNIYCGKRENMLPDDYGYKPYDELDDNEKAVADSFEGRDSYIETYTNQQFYLTQGNLLMLKSG